MMNVWPNLEVKLALLKRTLYCFLNHLEGIILDVQVDHKEELKAIYTTISTSGLLAETHSRMEGLADVSSNSTSEKISKVKAPFV